MQRLTVKNISSGPYTARTNGGVVVIGPGETRENLEFTDGEARNINENKTVFEVSGYVDTGDHGQPVDQRVAGLSGQTGKVADEVEAARSIMSLMSTTAKNLGVSTPDELPKAVADLMSQRDNATNTLTEIAAMFPDYDPGTITDPEAIKAKVQGLIEQVAAFDGDGDGKTGGSQGDAKLSLADAVASLKDDDDKHWIKSGKPDLEILKGLTGADVTRAEVDAIGRERKTA